MSNFIFIFHVPDRFYGFFTLKFLHLRPCAFFSMFLVTFFHQTYAGVRKQNKMPKEKKHRLSVPNYLTNKWHTELIVLSAVERSHSFVYFLPNNDRVKQLPVATKVWLFLVLVLDLSSRAKNVIESSTETFINIENAFVLPRSLVRWEARPRFRFQTKHIWSTP